MTTKKKPPTNRPTEPPSYEDREIARLKTQTALLKARAERDKAQAEADRARRARLGGLTEPSPSPTKKRKRTRYTPK